MGIIKNVLGRFGYVKADSAAKHITAQMLGDYMQVGNRETIAQTAN